MKTSKIKPTFLLQCLIVGGAFGILVLAFVLTSSTTITITTLLIFVIIWVLGFELNLIPELILHFITKRAQKTFRESHQLHRATIRQETANHQQKQAVTVRRGPTGGASPLYPNQGCH